MVVRAPKFGQEIATVHYYDERNKCGQLKTIIKHPEPGLRIISFNIVVVNFNASLIRKGMSVSVSWVMPNDNSKRATRITRVNSNTK